MSARQTPRPRVPEVDFVRGASVLLMIAVHTLVFFASAAAQTRGLVAVLLTLGKGTALFVVCMGISAAFARDRSLRGGLQRGLRLVLLGYALNALKFLVPMAFFGGLPEALLRDLGRAPGDPANVWYFLFLGDILALAGIATAVLAALRALGARPAHAFVLGAVVALVAPSLWGARFGGPVVGYLADLFFGAGYEVFFPVFPWLSFALVGFGLGDQLRATRDAPALLRRWFLVGAALLLAGGAVLVLAPSAFAGRDFYRAGPGSVATSLGCALLAFQLAAWIPVPERGLALLRYASCHVTRLYVVSWVVIAWGTKVFVFMGYDAPLALLSLVALVFASTFLVDALFRGTSPRASIVPGELS